MLFLVAQCSSDLNDAFPFLYSQEIQGRLESPWKNCIVRLSQGRLEGVQSLGRARLFERRQGGTQEEHGSNRWGLGLLWKSRGFLGKYCGI